LTDECLALQFSSVGLRLGAFGSHTSILRTQSQRR
jgi:hypothetical protein